jgi:hypothetical protein
MAVCGAIASIDHGASPLTVARGAAKLLTILGALGIGITLTRRIILRLRGRRHPTQWLAEWLFFTGGLGWSLLLPGAAAFFALHGEPGTSAYLAVLVLAFITIMFVAAGAFMGFVFLLDGKKDKYAFLAIVHVPAVLFFSIALRMLVAAWRAI